MGRSIREFYCRIPMGHASQPPMGLRALNHLPLTCSKIATFYWNIVMIELSRSLSLNSLGLFSNFHVLSKFPKHFLKSIQIMCLVLEGADQKEYAKVNNHANMHNIAILSITSELLSVWFLEGPDQKE